MTDQRNAWDLYWQADRISSCMGGPGQSNYDSRIADGWRAFFEALQPGARILDVCTGNGAVAIIATETSRLHGKSFEVVGVDLAHIDPARFVSQQREDIGAVRFVGDTAAEELPFGDGAFDAVVSQYGIEYSDLGRALPEALRVLARPGGQLRFGLHAAEGSVAAESEGMLADAKFLLDEIDLPGAAARCFAAVRAIEQSGAADASAEPEADRRFAEFDAALKAAAAYLPQATDQQMVHNTGAVLLDAHQKRGFFDLPILLEKAEQVRTEILAHRERLRALLAAAKTAAQVQVLAQRVEQLGLREVGWSEQRAAERLIGYSVEGQT